MKQLLQFKSAWWSYHEKHKDTIRPIVVETVTLLLACGMSLLGYATFRCINTACEHVKRICFGCNSRFCNTCGKKRTDQWLENMKATLPDTKWQHITFTLPDELWCFFEANRPLQGNLSALAANTLLKSAKKKKLLPGIFTAIHTFGRDLKWNVHIHLAITLGGITDNGKQWKKIVFCPTTTMRRWRYQVVNLLRAEYKKGELIIPTELQGQIQNTQQLNQFLNQQYEKHWHVHFANPTKTPLKTIKYLGRYLKRPPLALSRLKHYDGSEVVFEYLDHHTQKHRLFRCDVEAFIQRLIRHIPEKHFRMIRYYGFLAHRVRGKLMPTVYDLLNQPEKKAQQLYFAELMQYTYGLDPLKCILCGSQMAFEGITVGVKRSMLHLYHRELALQKEIKKR